MKNKLIGLLILSAFFVSISATADVGSPTYQRVKAGSAPDSAQPVASQTEQQATQPQMKKGKKGEVLPPPLLLTIGEDQELTFPAGLKECKVFDSKSLEKAIHSAVWKGGCEWIVLRSNSDWDPTAPVWLQLDKPIVIENKYTLAEGHPVVITNDTGRAILFKAPKNGGCTIIIKKPDVAILGFTFEGAICH